MDSHDTTFSAEALLSDTAWVRRVARGLCGDLAAAEDVAQDAWLVARRAESLPGTRSAGERAPWLAGVVRHLAQKRRRGEQRRSKREELGARRELQPSTSDLVERAEMQRHVVDAVLGLHEPYRSTVLLAYLEGLTSVEIARREGVSDGTVRWRLKRGLELLRADLERRRGREWLASCALLAGISSTLTPSKLLPGVLGAKLALASATVVAAGGALVATRGGESSASVRVAREELAVPDAPLAPGAALVPDEVVSAPTSTLEGPRMHERSPARERTEISIVAHDALAQARAPVAGSTSPVREAKRAFVFTRSREDGFAGPLVARMLPGAPDGMPESVDLELDCDVLTDGAWFHGTPFTMRVALEDPDALDDAAR